ncbi:MAG: hypothetical protein V7K92_12025 [Nostoc sp.]|uniref:hypothetical protein n=1 Tax=Nostoc sp. TaxID=1180 RepID=UPI002FEEA4F9
MSTTISEPIVTWEKLPDDFSLPDEPVDNISQPAIAFALTESLELAVFEPEAGWVEVYQLSASGQYELQQPNGDRRYWIASIGLFLGIWQGVKVNRTSYWLRWWDETGQLLLWGVERLQQEQQLRSRMAAKLRELNIDPETV